MYSCHLYSVDIPKISNLGVMQTKIVYGSGHVVYGEKFEWHWRQASETEKAAERTAIPIQVSLSMTKSDKSRLCTASVA